MAICLVASSFETSKSTPLVLRNVIDAILPRLVSSAATKYSPEIPAEMFESLVGLVI